MSFRRKSDLPAPAMRALVTRLLEPGIRIERTLEGGSTQVYRLFRETEVLYLRVAEEAGESMAPETEVHTRLLAAGVKVPEVVAVESFAPEIDRSVMIVRAIAGAPLSAGADSATAGRVVREAGRDLALINSIPVEGYGWIRRDVEGWPLRGECSTFRDFVEGDVGTVPGFDSDVFSEDERRTIEYLFDSASQDRPEARLVHGDADPTAIFHAAGTYTGLIDFGEIRGGLSSCDGPPSSSA